MKHKHKSSTTTCAALVLMFSAHVGAAEDDDVPRHEVQPHYAQEIADLQTNKRVQAAFQHVLSIEPQSRCASMATA